MWSRSNSGDRAVIVSPHQLTSPPPAAHTRSAPTSRKESCARPMTVILNSFSDIQTCMYSYSRRSRIRSAQLCLFFSGQGTICVYQPKLTTLWLLLQSWRIINFHLTGYVSFSGQYCFCGPLLHSLTNSGVKVPSVGYGKYSWSAGLPACDFLILIFLR